MDSSAFVTSESSDFDGNYSLGFDGPAKSLAALSIVGPLFAVIFVINRVYWRFKKLTGLWWDDYCIVLSTIFLVAQSAAALSAGSAGYGIESSQLTSSGIQTSLYYFFHLQIYYKLTINLTKASIVLLYYRIFTTRLFRQTCLLILTIIMIFMVVLTSLTIFQCTPVHKIYQQSIDGTCLPPLTLWRVNAFYNILSDIVIIAMPFPVLRSLRLPTGQFIGLALILCCGIFVILTAILRYTTLSTAGHSNDPTAGTLTSTVWTEAEACVAIVCACLPMVRVLLQKCIPCLRNISSRSSRSARGAGAAMGAEGQLQRYENLSTPSSPSSYPQIPQLPNQRSSAHEPPFSQKDDIKLEEGVGQVRGIGVYT